MSTQNELWFKEPVTIYLANGVEVEGVNVCFIRNLEENQEIDELDMIQEVMDFMEGTAVGTLYREIEFPDGSVGYIEVDEYEGFESYSVFQLVGNPFEGVSVV
jgi:hypothetical protein